MTNQEMKDFVDDFARIEKLMKKGIHKDEKTGREYFTGYSYNTLYDWDQYFDAIVQLYLDWDTKYIKNGIKIFLDHQREDGFIMRRIQAPITPEEKAKISPEITHITEEENKEMIKPFLSQIIFLLYKHERDLTWLTPDDYNRLKKYINYWIDQAKSHENGLAVWNSAPHSGMDDQVERAGGWGACVSQGVDLNSFLYRECRAFSFLADLFQKKDDTLYFSAEAEHLKNQVRTILWCEEDGFFYDFRLDSGKLVRVKSSVGFAPLWAGIATKNQAERLVREHLLNPAEFWRAFPIPSYAANQTCYREERLPGDVGCNWRAQTWIPVNYYVAHGLADYGYVDIFRQLSFKTYKMVKKIGEREYYNTDSCTGKGLNPFWGWSLLAYFMPMEAELGYDPTKLSLGLSDIAKIRVV